MLRAPHADPTADNGRGEPLRPAGRLRQLLRFVLRRHIVREVCRLCVRQGGRRAVPAPAVRLRLRHPRSAAIGRVPRLCLFRLLRRRPAGGAGDVRRARLAEGAGHRATDVRRSRRHATTARAALVSRGGLRADGRGDLARATRCCPRRSRADDGRRTGDAAHARRARRPRARRRTAHARERARAGRRAPGARSCASTEAARTACRPGRRQLPRMGSLGRAPARRPADRRRPARRAAARHRPARCRPARRKPARRRSHREPVPDPAAARVGRG